MPISDEMVDAAAFAMTGHICGQSACSNRAGWQDATKPCACRHAARAALEAAEAVREREVVTVPREAFQRMLTSAAMLLQNAEGCAVNHYGEDFSIHGMPGWLADCATDIETVRALASSGGNRE